MGLNRREFLGAAGALTAASLLPYWPSHGKSSSKAALIAGASGLGNILWMDMATLRQERVRAPLIPHSFLRHPLAERTIIAIEKAGDKTAVCDFKTGKMEKLIECPKEFEFYGHGVFSADGKTLYITRVDRATGIGHLAVYDSKTYKEQGYTTIAPGGVHDTRLLADGKTLLVTSSGLQVDNRNSYGARAIKPRIEKSSLVYLDLETGKVKDKHSLEVEDQVIGHFALSADEKKVIAITIPFVDGILSNTEKGKGAVYVSATAGPFKKVTLPAEIQTKIRGEFLSVAIADTTDRFYVTNPNGSLVLEFKNSTDEFLKSYPVQMNGIAPWTNSIETEMVMNPTTGMEGKAPFSTLRVKSGEIVPMKTKSKESFVSAHLLITAL